MAKKKSKLPFNTKKLDRGSGELRAKIKALGNEWRNPNTSPARKKKIEKAYHACMKQWNKIHDVMAKHGIHIGLLD